MFLEVSNLGMFWGARLATRISTTLSQLKSLAVIYPAATSASTHNNNNSNDDD
jgi:dienelactone hydrolase